MPAFCPMESWLNLWAATSVSVSSPISDGSSHALAASWLWSSAKVDPDAINRPAPAVKSRAPILVLIDFPPVPHWVRGGMAGSAASPIYSGILAWAVI